MKKHEVLLQAEEKDVCDVLVIGGGVAGVAAAVSAARCGKKTILLEQSGMLGGSSTAGGVHIFMSVGNVTGFYEEICRRLLPKKYQEANPKHFAPQFNAIQMRYLLTQMVKEAGVTTYYHTKYVAPIQENGKISGIIAATREGIKAFSGMVVIDCSADARVAIDCGVGYTTGRESDSLTQPVTLMFQMQDTGKPVPRHLPEDCPYYEQISDLPQGRLLHWEQLGTGTLLVNMTRLKGNGGKIDDINYFESEALKQVLSVTDYLQRNGYETYILSSVASYTGVRESNQIKGVYTLSDDDVLHAHKFDDVISQSNYEIDIHSPTGGKTCDERKIETYDIPYRTLVTNELENLLVAGRCLSATHLAMSSVRTMPTCFNLGQAAGLAAVIACDTSCDVKDISIDKLHQLQEEQGVVFE